MESESLFVELEPDANEIMFGQQTLPDRPLTTREASKRKKILMKLVDQRLKFKLVELMRQQVASQHDSKQKQEDSVAAIIPTVSQTINAVQPSYSFSDYQSQPNWTNWSDSGLQHVEGNWQPDYSAGLQPSIYPPYYGTMVETSWNNNCNFQPNIQSNVEGNVQYFHQNLNVSRKRPGVDASRISNSQISKKISTEVRGEPSPASHSSLISINCVQEPPNQSHVIQPSMKNQLPAAAPPVSNIPQAITTNTYQMPQSTYYTLIERSANGRPTSRRRRRYGRGNNQTKRITASACAGNNVVFGDKFGLRCINSVTSTVATDGHSLWNEINRLVTSIFRQEANQIEPLSSYEQKLHNRVSIAVSTNPDVLRSDRDVSQFLSRNRIEETISKVKLILQQVRRSNPQVQSDFAQIRDNLISDLKAMNEKMNAANVTENVQLIHTKISEVVAPLLSADVDEAARNKLVTQLATDPRTLETSDVITKPIADKVNVMREIKRILDEHMMARPGKQFYIPIHRTIDVPFVVTVHEKSNKMAEENLQILLDALIAKVESVVSVVQPKIIDPQFCGGTLVMVCANRKTFELIKTTISGDFNGKWTGADLSITPAQIKNPLARSELKTVLMKFTEPQFGHFNDLMIQLKVDNPSLLVRRWELREPPADKAIDSTEGIYVGVDMESLGPIEQLNRVARLFKSTVTFEISYDDSEGNYLPDHSLLVQ